MSVSASVSVSVTVTVSVSVCVCVCVCGWCTLFAHLQTQPPAAASHRRSASAWCCSCPSHLKACVMKLARSYCPGIMDPSCVNMRSSDFLTTYWTARQQCMAPRLMLAALPQSKRCRLGHNNSLVAALSTLETPALAQVHPLTTLKHRPARVRQFRHERQSLLAPPRAPLVGPHGPNKLKVEAALKIPKKHRARKAYRYLRGRRKPDLAPASEGGAGTSLQRKSADTRTGHQKTWC